MQRRQLLQWLAAAPLAGVSSRLIAAPGAGSRLLLVFLRGGYDATSLLVPHGSDFYYAARPNIAIARPNSATDAALALDSDWGLHPVLQQSLYPLYQNRQLAFVPFAGSEDLSRSHFETQDSIELGQPLNGRRDFQSGFLNRLAGVLRGERAIALTEQLPLIMRGEVQIANQALRHVAKPALDARQVGLINAMYANTPLARQVSDGFGVRDEIMRELAAEMDSASRNAASSKGFEQEARRIARLLQDKYSIGFVDIGGWDTHVGQGAASGYLAGRLDELGRGLAAFAEEMGNNWNNTVVVVISEFGRTFRENGNRGTDHGHGSVYWVLGGGIGGGRIVGEQMRIDRASLLQDRDLPVLNDYRTLLGGLLRRLYGLNAAQCAQIFPATTPVDLGLL